MLKSLEQTHGPRRHWLWAEMGQAALAQALEALSRLATLASKPFGGQQLQDMTDAYRAELWQVDAAAREGLAAVRTKADTDAVSTALQAVYVAWLEESNHRARPWCARTAIPVPASCRSRAKLIRVGAGAAERARQGCPAAADGPVRRAQLQPGGVGAARHRQESPIPTGSVQLRGFDAAKTGSQVGVATLIALCSSLLKKPLRGGLVIIGEINLGGSIEPIHNALTLVEIALEKGAQVVLMPVSSRRQLFDLSDDMATKVDTQFYQDARDALLKALVE